MKRGLTYIFKSWLRFPKGLIAGTAVIAAAFMVLPFVMHEPLGEDDYMFPKIFLFMSGIFMTNMGILCGCRDLGANKLTPSMPIAKSMYTRSAPMFIVILGVGTPLVLLCAYFIFLGIIGAETVQFSDTLLMGAVVCGPLLIFMPLLARVPGGGLFGMYPSVLPVVLLMLFCGNEKKINGFGVPLPISAGIFAAVLVLGTVWAFWISAVKYKKSDVKVYAAMVNNV